MSARAKAKRERGDSEAGADGREPLRGRRQAGLPTHRRRIYNLTDDLSETKNIAAAHPDLVAEVIAKLAEIKARSRSRP